MALSDAQEYDPFAAFDDAVAGTTRDPYPDLVAKRRDTPVQKGLTMNPDSLPEGIEVEPGWIAYRYDDCSRILRDAKTFTSTGYDVTIGMVMGHMILGMDDPEHRGHRNLVAHAFREKALARWEPEFIRPIIDEQIDRFAADGEADLVRQLTFEFPVRVIARLLGLPEEDFPQFQRWSVELISLVADIDRGIAASESLREYFAGVVAERRAHPAEDVISDLVSAEIDGEKLTDEAIYSFLRLLLPAGAETTYRSSGNLLYLLLTHPEQLEAVQADRSLLPQAIEEGLRFEPPLLSINRTTTCEVEIGRRHHRPRREHLAPHRLGQPRRDALGRPRILRHLPARHTAHRVRARAAHVPGHASRPARDPRPAEPRLRPPARPHAPARRRRPPHPRRHLPLPHLAAGHLQRGVGIVQPIRRISTSSPRAMSTVDTSEGGNSPWATTPGAASSRAARPAGSSTSPW